jgi:hypothetical protein
MRRLSSPLTSFYKRALPVLWLLVLAAFAGRAVWRSPSDEAETLVLAGVVAAIGLTVFLRRIRPLADEAWIDGDTLLVVTRRHVRTRIALREVTAARATASGLRYVVVSLRDESPLGRTITFLPLAPAGFFASFKPHPVAAELMERVRALPELSA